MKKYLSFLLLFVSAFVFAQQIQDTLIHNGKEREYYIHLPQSYDSSQDYPLVIALHGGNGKAQKFNKSTKGRFNKLSNSENFIVVYPQGIDKSWNDHPNRNIYGEARLKNIDDVGFIDKLINKLQSQYAIDSSKVFACGISNGGLMSATLALKLPNKIKAIAMIASNFSQVFVDEIKEDSITVKPFSILLIQGVDDPIFPFKEGEISIFRQKRGRVIGAQKTIDFMRAVNGNSSDKLVTKLPNNAPFDGCTETQIDYSNSTNPNLKVRLIKVEGGGHTMPGGYQYLPKKIVGAVTRDFNAADKIWEFFKILKD